MVPPQRKFDWNTSAVSAALAVRFLLFGLMGPFAAARINRFGVRRMVLTALAIVTTALVMTLTASRKFAAPAGGALAPA